MRIFDNPSHPQYGPVRRMWVMLKQLDLLAFADSEHAFNGVWDSFLALQIAERPGAREATHHFAFMGMLFDRAKTYYGDR